MLKFFAVILAISAVQARSQEGDDFFKRYQKVIDTIYTNATLMREFEASVHKDGSESLPKIDFTCSPEPAYLREPSRSVHELRPQDIKIVGVLGDSVNAGIGVGARNLLEVIFENRGESFLGGGGQESWGNALDDNIITLPNILKKFNSDLKGWAYGLTFVGSTNFRNARNNKAVSGAKAKDLVGQASRLIDEMRRDPYSFENDWKIISIFIGGNDLCQSCEDSNLGRGGAITGEEYTRHIQNAIDLLHDQVPKVLVNLVTMFDITPLASMRTGLICDIAQNLMCNCPSSKTAKLRDRQLEYSLKLTELVNSGRYDTREDFTVVQQQHMRDSVPPKIPGSEDFDPTWLSFDCFHPARKFHQAMAILLWNSMLTNNYDKVFGVELDNVHGGYRCPTKENPYIYTGANSHPDLNQVDALAERRLAKLTEEQPKPVDDSRNPIRFREDMKKVDKNPEVVKSDRYETKGRPAPEAVLYGNEPDMKETHNRVQKVKEYLRRNSVDPFPAEE